MKPTILAMGAHPDDMELEAGGTLAKFAKKGYNVNLLILTSGGYTDSSGNKYSNDQLKNEAIDSSKILGIKNVIFLDYETTNLPSGGSIIGEVDSIVDDLRPDVFISHHPFDSHQDHKAAADIMFAVSRQGRVKTVLSGSTLPYRPNVFAFRPQFFVDITETIDVKLEAIRAYNTQYTKFGGELLIERVKAMAKTHGWAMGYDFAECFEVIRMDDNLWV
ncbi:LmbE family N-acetylglucosaminyl deacetylase [Methanohalophilus levihalophilus]|uniref:PIG-L deacetylase family protein n=1 Tax=Methanohalophilus levihalophilus TaxID=1431282 RepID=UPI001AE15A70|nr:PIG-L family deacetylase [Methanohalophilus levihalophilus]MBP2029467.1 LmbE family N-acetylglucosaminyl deacetylase [Methanohalophilus levihalophilus]